MKLARRKVATAFVVALSLLFAHLPNTSAPAATYCIGPAAYPPDLPDCLDPVVEAKKEADEIAQQLREEAAEAAERARIDKEAQQALAEQIRAALEAATKDVENSKDNFDKLAELAAGQAREAEDKRKQIEQALKEAKEEEDGRRERASEVRRLAELAIKNLAADQEAAEQKIQQAKDLQTKLKSEFEKKLQEAEDAQRAFDNIKATLKAEIESKREAEAKAKKLAEELNTEAENQLIKLNTAKNTYENAKEAYENSLKGSTSLKSRLFFVNPEYEREIVQDEIGTKFLSTDLGELRKIFEEAQITFQNQQKIEAEAKENATKATNSFQTTKLLREQAELPVNTAETKMKTATTAASKLQSDLTNAQTAVLTAEGEKVKIEATAKNLAAEASALEAQTDALASARKSKESQLIAAASQVKALEETKSFLLKGVTGVTAALSSIQEATEKVEILSNEAEKSASIAEVTSRNIELAISNASKATSETIRSLEESRIANNILKKAEADRAAAVAANKPKPLSDKEYLLLVAAAQKEAEEAAIKKTAEEKARAEAEDALKKFEEVKKSVEYLERTKIEEARVLADKAQAEAEQLIRKITEDIAVAEAKSAAAIDAAKSQAQAQIDKIRRDLRQLLSQASKKANLYRQQASELSLKSDAAESIVIQTKSQLVLANKRLSEIRINLDIAEKKIIKLEDRSIQTFNEESSLNLEIAAIRSKIRKTIEQFEQVRSDISALLVKYNETKSQADKAAFEAASKREQASRSKIILENALSAYRIASQDKNFVVVDKPQTLVNLESDKYLQKAASAPDIAKLRDLADQAQSNYERDKSAAELASRVAEKTLMNFEVVKASLESKVARGKILQVRIRALQDNLSALGEKMSQILDSRNTLQDQIRGARAQFASIQNLLTIALVQRQNARIAQQKAEFLFKRLTGDVRNAENVAEANQLAVTAAEDAAIDIEVSSNAIDEIVSSKIIDDSIKSLPAIVATVSVIALASFALLLSRRAIRRRKHPILAPVDEDFSDLEFDFDRILSEIKQKQMKSSTVAKARTTKAAVKKPNQGKR